MKQFVFKLQTALDVKLKEEDMRKEELRESTRVYKHNLRLLNALKNRLAEIQDILRVKQTEKIDLLEIKNCQDYIPVLGERIKQQEMTTENSRQEMEQVRNKLVETIKERKMLEKLKTRHYQEYMKEYLWEEQKQIDEMAAVGFMHRDSAV